MYLIVKEQGGFRAIPIGSESRWRFRKVSVGRKEIRLILCVNGRQYTVYTTHSLTAQYPAVDRERLDPLCDELISRASEGIRSGHRCIDFTILTTIAETRHRRMWCDAGLITPSTPDEYFGHPVDPQTETLIARVRVDNPDVIVADQDPAEECGQEDLPY